MRVYDIIKKKRDGMALSEEEIRFFVEGYTCGAIPDYQASALMMAVYYKGMTPDETAVLTDAMAKSGDTVDLSEITGPIVDKHSTGGVGDKTTLVVAPIVASCGVKIAKMSGAGLGHTGGTTDKLLSIPGVRLDFSKEEFISIVNSCGACVCSSTASLAPADKKLYALRDVTATVDSIPLIAASIMSKKIASGSKNIVLDVKAGSGAFMKRSADAKALAREMVSIGDKNGLNVTALITNMDAPLGYAIGNSLEVIEAVQTLKGIGPSDLTDICLHLSSELLYLAGKGSLDECFDMAKNALFSGLALERFIWMVSSQGGDTSVISNTSLFQKSKYFRTVKTRSSGYIQRINAEKCGIAAMLLGAGRKAKDDVIEYGAGIILDVKPGSFVKTGDRIATLYAENESLFDSAISMLSDAFDVGEECPAEIPMVIDKFSNR
ncbi:MAG: thymidine phosphorylase [Clostridia bacterium]|nr:thymidine phosphorylase [Clostridia bacterium]